MPFFSYSTVVVAIAASLYIASVDKDETAKNYDSTYSACAQTPMNMHLLVAHEKCALFQFKYIDFLNQLRNCAMNALATACHAMQCQTAATDR